MNSTRSLRASDLITMTFKELYEYGMSQLNTEEKEAEVTILLEKAFGIDRKSFLLYTDTEISDDVFESFDAFLQKRKNGEPVQYIVGETNFYGFDFYVKKGVLIPRFDTENLVEKALEATKAGDKILDVCTGSGCILLTILKMKKDISGVGTDISDDALSVARLNADRLKVDAEFVKSDMFENITGLFDIIVSNPPYIESKVINSLEEQVKDYEPRIALDGGDDGLKFYRIISYEAKKHLKKNGTILFEIGYDQGETVPFVLKNEGYTDIKVTKDLCGNDRVVSAVYGG